MNLASILTEASERHPENVAVVFRDVSLTYRELDDRSIRLAHVLYEGVLFSVHVQNVPISQNTLS